MRPRALVLIILALVVAGATTYVARAWLSSIRSQASAQSAPVKPAEPRTQVLVAAKNLPAGHFIRAEDLRWQDWPSAKIAESYLSHGKFEAKSLHGSVVRAGIANGEPITAVRVVKPGESGFLAAVLEPEMRAISVAVNATSGNAGFIFPGDRVDLLLVQNIRKSRDKTRRAAETILEDLKVLAVDQKTNDQDPKAAVAKTVTLQVTPKQAEYVAVSTGLGRLSLTLRALKREPDDATAQSEHAPRAPLAAAGEPAEPVDDINPADRPPREKVSYTWDVQASAIQRSTISTKARKHVVTVVRGGKSKQQSFKAE